MKTTAYVTIFKEKHNKLLKKIKKGRKDGSISKECFISLIKEAKKIRKLLKEFEDGT